MPASWLAYALGGACLSAVWSLSMKTGVEHVFAADFTSGYVMVAAVLVTIANLAARTDFRFERWGLLAGAAQAVAGVCLTLSFATAPNPGLTMSVFRTQSLLTAVLAYFIFGASLTLPKIVAMAVVAVGVYCISTPREDFDERGGGGGEGGGGGGGGGGEGGGARWVVLALAAGCVMSLKDIATKKALLQKHSIRSVLWNTLVVQAVLIAAYDRATTGSFGFHDVTGSGDVTHSDRLLIVWTGAIFLLYVATVIASTQLAPNVGYAKAVDTFGVIITTVAAHYIFGSPITRNAILGILLVVGGIAYVSFA